MFFVSWVFICSFFCILDIEAQIRDIQSKKKENTQQQEADKGVGLLDSGSYYDSELYENSKPKSKFDGYVTSIAPNDMEDDEDEGIAVAPQKRSTYTAPNALLKDIGPVGLFSYSMKTWIIIKFSVNLLKIDDILSTNK